MRYENSQHFLVINIEKEEINYNGNTEPMFDYYLAKGDKGNVNTKQYTIKFSKDQALVFDTITNSLVDTLHLKVQDKEEQFTALSVEEQKVLVSTFGLKQGVVIKLYSEKINNSTVFSIEVVANNSVILSENIVDTIKMGLGNNYITKSGNKLFITNFGNSKWNGTPIGRLN